MSTAQVARIKGAKSASTLRAKSYAISSPTKRAAVPLARAKLQTVHAVPGRASSKRVVAAPPAAVLPRAVLAKPVRSEAARPKAARSRTAGTLKAVDVRVPAGRTRPVEAVVPLPPVASKGLLEVIALGRLIKSLTAMKAERSERLKPGHLDLYRTQAKALDDGGELIKTVAVEDGEARAQVQLRTKPMKAGLSPDMVKLFTRAKIPLSLRPARAVVSPRYSDPNDETALMTVTALIKLVAAHPEAGLPADLFATTVPVSLPAETALLRGLKHDDAVVRKAVLDLLADTVIIDSDITDAAYRKAIQGSIGEIERGLAEAKVALVAVPGAKPRTAKAKARARA